MTKVQEITEAFRAAKLANLSSDELIELEKREKYALAQEEGFEWAREIALKEGHEEGLREGLEQGRIEERRRMIIKLLEAGILSKSEIAAMFELQPTDIEEIDTTRLVE